MSNPIDTIRNAAAGYEPVLVASIVGAIVALLVGVGIPQVTSLSDEVDAVLTFLAFLAPIVAGGVARAKVVTVKHLEG